MTTTTTAGVKSVQASLETQKITVQHASAVAPDVMLSALKKWGDAGGKRVELIA